MRNQPDLSLRSTEVVEKTAYWKREKELRRMKPFHGSMKSYSEGLELEDSR